MNYIEPLKLSEAVKILAEDDQATKKEFDSARDVILDTMNDYVRLLRSKAVCNVIKMHSSSIGLCAFVISYGAVWENLV